MAILKQTVDNDLDLTGGQLRLVTNVAEQAATELRNKFLFVKGEYFLDTREGMPYFEFVFVKNPDLALIRSIFSRVILGQQGVSSLLSLDVSLTADRRGRFSFRALCDNGAVISGGSGQPFIVEPQ